MNALLRETNILFLLALKATSTGQALHSSGSNVTLSMHFGQKLCRLVVIVVIALCCYNFIMQ